MSIFSPAGQTCQRTHHFPSIFRGAVRHAAVLGPPSPSAGGSARCCLSCLLLDLLPVLLEHIFQVHVMEGKFFESLKYGNVFHLPSRVIKISGLENIQNWTSSSLRILRPFLYCLLVGVTL